MVLDEANYRVEKEFATCLTFLEMLQMEIRKRLRNPGMEPIKRNCRALTLFESYNNARSNSSCQRFSENFSIIKPLAQAKWYEDRKC